MKTPNKNNGFKIPENYLENFNNSLLDKIASQEESKIPNKEGFRVPDGYFSSVHEKIAEQLEQKPTKVISLNSYKKYYYSAIAVAAAILLFVGINMNFFENQSLDTIANTDIEAYLEFTDVELSTYDIAEVISVDNLDVTELFIHNIQDENVLEYLEYDMDNFHELNLYNDEEY